MNKSWMIGCTMAFGLAVAGCAKDYYMPPASDTAVEQSSSAQPAVVSCCEEHATAAGKPAALGAPKSCQPNSSVTITADSTVIDKPLSQAAWQLADSNCGATVDRRGVIRWQSQSGEKLQLSLLSLRDTLSTGRYEYVTPNHGTFASTARPYEGFFFRAFGGSEKVQFEDITLALPNGEVRNVQQQPADMKIDERPIQSPWYSYGGRTKSVSAFLMFDPLGRDAKKIVLNIPYGKGQVEQVFTFTFLSEPAATTAPAGKAKITNLHVTHPDAPASE